MSDAPSSRLGYAAIRATHGSTDSPRLAFDTLWLGRVDARDLDVTTAPALADRIVVGFDSLRTRGDDPSIASERARLFAAGITRFLASGECGSLVAEVTERGFVMPGDLVVGASAAGHAVGGLGALFVQADDLAAAARSGAVTLPNTPSRMIEITGTRGRWVDAIDLGLGLFEKLNESGFGDGPLELGGPALEELAVADRLVLCGVLGALRAAPVIAAIDAQVIAWLRARAQRTPDLEAPATNPPDRSFDISSILPSIRPSVLPTGIPSSSGCSAVCDVANTPIRTVLVGGALGGRLEDLRVVTRTFREHPIHDSVTCVVVPATPRTLIHAAHEGLIPVLLRAGVRIEAPGSRSFADLAAAIADEGMALSTVFDEPLPAAWSHVSPAVAAASAILGRVTHPDEILRRRKESV